MSNKKNLEAVEVEVEVEVTAAEEYIALLQSDLSESVEVDTTSAQLAEVQEINEAEENLRQAIADAMAKKGLASVLPSTGMIEAMPNVAGWRAILLSRLVALCKCHKKGASYVVKTADLDLSSEQVRVRDKRTKAVTIVTAQREKAMAGFVATLLKGCYDTTSKDKWGAITVLPAENPVQFTIEVPSEKRPTMRMHFLD